MSWLDQIQSLVFEPEELKPTVTLAASFASTTTTATPVHVSSVAPVNTAHMDGFLTKLRAKLQSPGSPVEKFEATLNSLTAIEDIGTRVTAAASVLKATAGVDAAQIRAAYNERLSAIEVQCGQFNTALDGQHSQADQMAVAVDAKNRDIQALTQQRDALSAEITAMQAKIATAQAGFDGAVATVRNEIQEAMNRLKGVQ